jgi:hypothetical protein
MASFKGPSQEKWPSEIFRFGSGKAANDPAVAGVPDPVGSEVSTLLSRTAVEEILRFSLGDLRFAAQTTVPSRLSCVWLWPNGLI